MPQDAAPPLVLVVEDDISTRKLYVAMLTERGFDVREAHNGLQAVEKAGELLPAAIVTDLALPGIDGFELCRRLHHDTRTRHIPVMAVTGRYVSPADLERARREGCQAVLVKPLEAARLVDELKGVLAAGLKAPLGIE
ncbi:MAG: two-component system, cell cycle response regulator DivK [Acidobacteriota bacterium]|jgi:CheY-like chemotaxis protein